MRNDLFWALTGAESNDTDVVNIENLPETVEEIAETVAAGEVAEVAAEVEEQGHELEDVAEQVEELQETVEELQAEVAGAESLLSSGAFNPQAFALCYGRAEKLHAKLGGEETDVVGAESLADATTAKLAARSGMEAFGATIKKYGAQAVAFIKKLYDTIISFIAGLFSRSAKVRNLAKAVKARLGANSKIKDTVKLGKWNAFVDVEGSSSELKPTILSTVLVKLAGASDACNDLIGNPGNHGGITKSLKELGDAVYGVAAAAGPVRGAKKGDVQTGTVTWRGLTIAASHYVGAGEGLEVAGKQAKAIRLAYKVSGGVKTSGDAKVSLTADKIKGYVTYAENLCAGLESSKVNAKFTSANRDRIIGLLNALDKKSDEGKDAGAAVGVVKSVFAALSSVSSVNSRLTMAIAEAQLQFARAALSGAADKEAA